MATSSSLPKLAAVVSALALGGGYVTFRHLASRPEPPQLDRRTMMPGSKNPVFTGATPGEIHDSPVERTDADFIAPVDGPPRTIFPSSKSAPLLLPEPEEEERTVLPGSKSIDRILRSPNRQKEEP